tara:strand:+ start:281 stop:769 length:489 start_codon:yes stop_codon:yes gene_type:complete
MKKILLLLLLSFIAKPDYSSAGLSYGTIDGDIDLLSLSYENVSSKFAVTGVVANADAGAADATLTEVMLDYGFGNFNEGSWFVGIEHARASGGGESFSDTFLNAGYKKASGEGLDWGVSIDSEEQDLTARVTQWLDDGLGIGARVTVFEEGELFEFSVKYKW